MVQGTGQNDTYSRVTSVMSKHDGPATRANVKVVVRVRPENKAEDAGNYGRSLHVLDEHVLVFDPKEQSSPDFYHGRKRKGRDVTKRKNKDVRFAFDQVFDTNTNNVEVYNATTRLILDGFLDGYNCSVFAYGATGAGKTFTMLGCPGQPGVIFFTMMDLYKHIDSVKNEKTCDVAISYLEVYNEQIRDLLMPGAYLPIREDPQKGAIITGLSLHKPTSADELMHMLAFGNQNRTQHPTDANAESSRSHAVFQVFVRQKDRTANISADVRVAKMSLIDLAGSERATVTTNRGARFREGANINKSLLALGNCINALAEGKQKGYIPYRNSKLTRLLKDSLGGNCRTVMIAAVSPSNMTYEDTHNTLKYANRAKNIKANLKRNTMSVDFHVSKYAKICEELRLEVSELKIKLEKYDEGTILNTAKNPTLPPAKLLEMEQLQGQVFRVFNDKLSIQKELYDAASTERDLIYRVHTRQRSLARMMTVFTDPNDQNLLTKRENAIAATIKRQKNVQGRKEKLLHNLQENNQWQSKVEASVEKICKDNTTMETEKLMASMKIQQVEIELRNSRRQLKVTRKICRAQEREAKSSEKLISMLLETVKQQFYLLRANGLATSDLVEEFDEIKLSLTGDKVMWADQSVCPDTTQAAIAVDGEQFNINQLLDFHPALGCTTPKTPHSKQLVQYLGTPRESHQFKTPVPASLHSSAITPSVPMPSTSIQDSHTLSGTEVSGPRTIVDSIAKRNVFMYSDVVSSDTPARAAAHSTPLPTAKVNLPGEVQFGSQTVTIDPAVSALINGNTKDVGLPGPEIPCSQTAKVMTAHSGEKTDTSAAALPLGIKADDTFTMDGVYPLQLSPTESNSAAPSCVRSTGNICTSPSPTPATTTECASSTAKDKSVPSKSASSAKRVVQTGTITKSKPSIINTDKIDGPAHKDFTRVLHTEFQRSPAGFKSFADAVKSPKPDFQNFNPRSPLASRENLPEFTPTGSNFDKQIVQVDPRRMTFAGNDCTRQKLFEGKGGYVAKGMAGPIRRQTITTDESKRMQTLHDMGLPSVAERKIAEYGRKANQSKVKQTEARAGPLPGYMQTTKAFSRRQLSHRSSSSSPEVNDENARPNHGPRRVPLDEHTKKKTKHLGRSKSAAHLYRVKRPAFV